MIDTDLIMNKEDYLKNDLINTLRDKINSVNKNNIDNSILEIQNILKEFNILNENNICLEKNILNEKSIEMLIDSIINTSHYNFENTSFNALKDFIKDSLITIGAESSVGKTSFASQLALEILENNDDTILVFYSLDDSKTFLTKKMILQLFNKNNKVFFNNDDDFIKSVKKYKNTVLKLLLSQRIAIFEKLNIYSMYSQLLELKNNAIHKLNIKKPKIIVVIDYLQIIEHDSINLREGLNKVCSYLKNIQKEFNCMMVLLSQFNRSKEMNINTLVRYRETSEIENISDLCINLESILDQDFYNTKLYIVKNKSGEKNKIFISSRQAYSFSEFKEYTNIRINNNISYNTDLSQNIINYDNIDDVIF